MAVDMFELFPTPWFARQNGVRANNKKRVVCTEQCPLAPLMDNSHQPYTDALRLIAAAPELLAALEVCADELAHAESMLDELGVKDLHTSNPRAAWTIADAVISKAKGESK